MNDVNKAIENISSSLSETPAMDHARNSLLLALSLVPVFGGAFSTLAGAYIPERREKRLLDFIAQLGSDVHQLKGKINETYVTTDEFAFLFEKTFRGVMDNYHQEKIEAFRAAFLNALVAPVDLNSETQELYIRLISDLTPRHIRVLRALVEPAIFDKANGSKVGSGSGMTTSLIEILGKLFPEYAEAEMDYIVADLDNLALTRMHSALRTMMTDTGIHQLEGRLTKFGQDFVGFITMPSIE